MKILYIFDTFNSGGAGRQFSLLFKGLRERGINSKLVVLEGKQYFNTLISLGYDISLIQRSFRYDIKPWIAISKIIRSYNPDIVHVWGWMSTFASHLMCKYLNVPLVGSLRDASLPSGVKNKSISKIKRLLLKHIIANSNAALRANNIQKAVGNLVYNGFDIDRISIEGKEYSHFTVVMAARMSKDKDWFCFLDAINILANDPLINEMRFVGLGDGNERNSILLRGKEFLTSGLLQLPGFVHEPMSWMINADVGVLTSSPRFREGNSNSILEYMASSLPVICTNTGGNLETVVEGETGYLINPSNPSELADRIVNLFDNRNLRKRMGKAGKKRVLEHYSLEGMITHTIQIYNSII